MSHSRAFTDTEIITIATVAAAALGGIVVGLGRGQDDDHPVDVRREQLSDGVERAREAGASFVSHLPDRAQNVDFRSVASSLIDSYKDAQSGGESFLQRSADKIGPMLSRDQIAERLPIDRSVVDRSRLEDLASRGRDSVKSSAQDLRKSGGLGDWIDTSAIADRIRSQVERQRHSKGGASAEGLMSQIGNEISSIEERVASAPEKLQSAREETGRLMRRKVSDPVSSAAATTKDATLDSVAALAWLSVGATVVYFGLLSSERREQVKDVLCGAIEQGRLLVLDFQGYEPEM